MTAGVDSHCPTPSYYGPGRTACVL
jgi:hypothetical protein